MRNYLRKIGAGLILALALFSAVPASAQQVNVFGAQIQPFKAVSVGDAVSAVDTTVAIYVKYVGNASATSTLAVAGNNSFAFVSGGVADATINVQDSNACGATPGTLDLTNANCDTYGELIDRINKSANWVAVLSGVLRSETSNANINNVAASTAVKNPDGLGLTVKTSAQLVVSAVLLPGGGRLSANVNGGQLGLPTLGIAGGIQNWVGSFLGAGPGSAAGYGKRAGAVNPFGDTDSVLLYASENVTSTGTVGNMIAYCVYEAYKFNGGLGSTETVQTLFQKAGAATTVTGTLNEFINSGGLSCSGGKLIYRISATTNLTAPTVVLSGYRKPRNIS